MTRTRMIAIALLVAVLVGIGLWAAVQGRSVPGPVPASADLRPGTPAEIRSHARGLHGDLVLINFWASWCGPCKDEFPALLKIRAQLKARGLRVVLVSVDEPADFGAAEEFLKAQGVDFPSFYKGAQSIGFMTDLYPRWSGAVPANILLGPDLNLVDAWEGQTSAEEYEARVLRHLK